MEPLVLGRLGPDGSPRSWEGWVLMGTPDPGEAGSGPGKAGS